MANDFPSENNILRPWIGLSAEKSEQEIFVEIHCVYLPFHSYG